MAHKRLSAYERDVHGTVLADDFQNALDERVAAKIMQIAEDSFSAQVRVAVGIAAGATQRAFARDFD
jgi:hypothetical protein